MKERKEFYRGESNDYEENSCVPTILRTNTKLLESKYYRKCFEYIKPLTKRNQMRTNLLKSIVSLSYMQHYGFKTRLLDVTKKEEVAVYFACSGNFDKQGFVYEIKEVQWCKKKTAKSVTRKIDFVFKDFNESNKLEKGTKIDVLRKNVVLDCKEAFNMDISNIRYDRQEGSFILVGNEVKDRIYNRDKITPIEKSCHEVIENTDKIKRLYELALNKSITRCFLFPDETESISLMDQYAECSVQKDFKLLEKYISKKYSSLSDDSDTDSFKINKGLIKEIIDNENLYFFVMKELHDFYTYKKIENKTLFLQCETVEELVRKLSSTDE